MNNETHMLNPLTRDSSSPTKQRLQTFQLFGYTGFLLSFIQSVLLAKHLGIPQLTLLGLTGTVILTFYVLMMVTKILANGEVIIYYHHEIAVIAACAAYLRLTHQSVLPYLDILVLGLGLFLAFGRIGCLMVGCCHGRPSKWGVTYGHDHVAAGFPSYLAGITLFPIQAVESATAFSIVAIGISFLLTGSTPGRVLELYVLAYGCARFCLEFFRGDPDRRYFLGFSEAQWTSLLLALAVAAGEHNGILPESKWHWIAAAAMGAVMIAVLAWRRFDPSQRFELLHPRHVREIINALDYMRAWDQEAALRRDGALQAPIIFIAKTSLGYNFSRGEADSQSCNVKHYSVSRNKIPLSSSCASVLCDLLAKLEQWPEFPRLMPGTHGIFHIITSLSPAEANTTNTNSSAELQLQT